MEGGRRKREARMATRGDVATLRQREEGSQFRTGLWPTTKDEKFLISGRALESVNLETAVDPERAGPNDFHRGALPSEGFPHDLSHFEVFSWLTDRPSSRSASPARISP